MPEPAARDEGSWDELARELGVDAPSSPPESESDPQPPPLPWHARAGAEADTDGFGEGIAAADEGEDGDDEGEEGAEGGEAGTEDGQPGTGRKRRRRRRRRKKGGPEGAQPAAPTEAAPDEEAGIVSAVPTEVDDRLETEADDAEVEEEAEADPFAPIPEEDTGSEVLRELISTWNVPAWDDIIAGLYRPDR